MLEINAGNNRIKQRFFFCPLCGEELSFRHDGERNRLTCLECGYILYEKPAVVVASIVINEQNMILLGCRKRGREKGRWCIPCGYVDYDEDVRDAAVRECKEETNLDIIITEVFDVQSSMFPPEGHVIIIWFLARCIGGVLRAQDDLSEAGYFHLDRLPEMAFKNDVKVIKKLKLRLIDNDKR